MKKQFFGPRKGRAPTMHPYGYLLREGNHTGTCTLEAGKMQAQFFDGVEDLWAYLTSPEAPALWYTSDANKFFYDVVLGSLSLERVLEKLLNSKAQEIEKLAVIPAGESDMMRIIVRQEKHKARSAKLHDLTFLNVKNLYPLGADALATDFGPFFGIADFKSRLLSGMCGLLALHQWIMEKLKVRPSLTLTSTALKALQTGVLKTAIPPLPKECETFIKKAIVGGQVELYQMLMPNCYQYDKNGGFGEASAKPMPMKGPFVVDAEGMTVQELMEDEHLGFVKVDVYVPEKLPSGKNRFRGPLPYRSKSKRTYYPVGRLKNQVYFTPLLKEAVLTEGVEIEKIKGGIFFTKSERFLEPWAEYTAKLKEEATCKGDKKLASLVQQTLWGKFNQEQTQQVVHIGRVPKDRMEDPGVNWPDPMLPVWYETVEVKLPHYLPHLAAAISSWAHVIGLRDIQTFEKLGLQAAYRDTDSWFLSGRIPKDMEGAKLGTYRLEHGPGMFLGLAPKLYFWLDPDQVEAKMKGVRKKARVMSEADVQRLLDGVPKEFSWDIGPTIEGAVVARYEYGKTSESADAFRDVIDAIVRRKVTRTLPGTTRGLDSYLQLDSKRKQVSFWESRPLHVSEID